MSLEAATWVTAAATVILAVFTLRPDPSGAYQPERTAQVADVCGPGRTLTRRLGKRVGNPVTSGICNKFRS